MDSLAGVRFYPTDQEIIRLLQLKRQNPFFSVPSIFEANIYDYEPEMLSRLPAIPSDGKWSSFYCEPNYIKSNCERVNRSTRTGYWKVTGMPCEIKAKRTSEVIGCKRTLVFYERCTGCKEVRTDWVMREFSAKPKSDFKKDFVVCRVKRKRDKKQHISTKNENKQAKQPLISFFNQGAFDNENHIAEKSSPEPQLLPSSCLLSASTSDDVENTYPESDYYSVFNSNNHVISDNLPLDPSLLENLSLLNGYTEVDQSSAILPEQLGSSYCFVSSNDNEVLNSPFGSEFRWEDHLQLEDWILVDQDVFPGEDTGHGAYS